VATVADAEEQPRTCSTPDASNGCSRVAAGWRRAAAALGRSLGIVSLGPTSPGAPAMEHARQALRRWRADMRRSGRRPSRRAHDAGCARRSAAHGAQTRRHADMQTRRHGLSHVSPCLVQGCLALQAAPWLDMLPARELRISISPKASPKLARGWALSRRDSRIIIPRRTAAAGLLPNPQAPRETSAKSAQRNALPLRRRPRPVTAQRIMQRANAHAGAYLHDSSSIKALPPQSAMCCHAAAARRLPPSRQGCNSSTPATATAVCS
jgi:hypothetical protein